MITSCPREIEIRAERVGREHRVAARVVGDREHVDPRIGRELARHLEDLPAAVRGDQAATRHELGGDDERAGSSELFAKRDHVPRRFLYQSA